MKTTASCRSCWQTVREPAISSPGSGGLRKIRWATEGKGKRSGARVIYYWAVARDQILMLFLFPKSERADLTPAQITSLRKIIEADYP